MSGGQEPKNGKGRRGLVIGGAVVALLALAGIAAYLLIGGGDAGRRLASDPFLTPTDVGIPAWTIHDGETDHYDEVDLEVFGASSFTMIDVDDIADAVRGLDGDWKVVVESVDGEKTEFDLDRGSEVFAAMYFGEDPLDVCPGRTVPHQRIGQATFDTGSDDSGSGLYQSIEVFASEADAAEALEPRGPDGDGQAWFSLVGESSSSTLSCGSGSGSADEAADRRPCAFADECWVSSFAWDPDYDDTDDVVLAFRSGPVVVAIITDSDADLETLHDKALRRLWG